MHNAPLRSVDLLGAFLFLTLFLMLLQILIILFTKGATHYESITKRWSGNGSIF